MNTSDKTEKDAKNGSESETPRFDKLKKEMADRYGLTAYEIESLRLMDECALTVQAVNKDWKARWLGENTKETGNDLLRQLFNLQDITQKIIRALL